MANDVLTIGLAELAAGRVGTVEAVTIVREIANRITEGTLPGVPSPQVIRLTPSGTIFIEGPIAADARTVAHAAYLLETLLPDPDVKTLDRVPGALRLIVARALGTLDLPPYTSLADFADALTRFAAPDATLCIQALVLSRTLEPAAAESLPVAINAAEPVTISDIRRARRATGLTLTEISARTGIPASLLCELEWGYLHHWPAPVAARRWLLRYARATGLDDELVLRTVWPILEDEARDRERKARYAPIVEVVPVEEPEVVGTTAQISRAISSPVLAHSPRTVRKPRRRAIAVAALAIPALFVIGIAPLARGYLAARRHQPSHVTVVADGSDNLPKTAAPVLNTTSAGSVQPVAISNSVTLSPAFATSGSAVFQTAASATKRTDTQDRAAVLRVIRIVDDRSHNFHARLSPDGRQIAFDSDRDGLRGVYVADRNGQHVRRVSGDGFAAIPTWSPDGRTLAVVRAEPDRSQVWNLWAIDLSTGQEKRLTSHGVGQSWGGSWFPDGQRIAYSHEGRVVVLSLSSGSTRTYPPPRAAEAVGIPAVSPDGRRALFQVTGDGSWLLDFRTGVMKKILSDPSAEAYSWSPDGRRVAYYSRATDAWGVWIMPPSR
jgi:Helix-turn-helix domain/WD40-like Beta Propeller Repeat